MGNDRENMCSNQECDGVQLVSVIMPMYNAEKFVGKTIRSLIDQTFENWELIVVNDGSTDGSAEVVHSFGDERIRYVYQQNKGVMRLAETLNRGLQEVRGRVVTMLPSDDLWPRDRLESQIPLFDNPNVVLCFGRQMLIDINDRVIGETKRPKNSPSLTNMPIGMGLKEMLQWNYIPQPTVLLRTEALRKIGGYLQPDGLYAEDYPTHMALAFEGEFRYLDKVLAHYRLHPHQMTRTHYLKMAETDADYVLSFFDRLSETQQRQTGWVRTKLVRAMKKRVFNAYFVVGRQLMLDRQWKKATAYFAKALIHGDFEAKMKSMLGMFCAALHIDMERFAVFSSRAAKLR